TAPPGCPGLPAAGFQTRRGWRRNRRQPAAWPASPTRRRPKIRCRRSGSPATPADSLATNPVFASSYHRFSIFDLPHLCVKYLIDQLLCRDNVAFGADVKGVDNRRPIVLARIAGEYSPSLRVDHRFGAADQKSLVAFEKILDHIAERLRP